MNSKIGHSGFAVMAVCLLCSFVSFLKVHLMQSCCSRCSSLNAELNLICHLLALLGAHPILHASRIRIKVKSGSSRRLVILQLSMIADASVDSD
jgi:hypothetical protein